MQAARVRYVALVTEEDVKAKKNKKKRVRQRKKPDNVATGGGSGGGGSNVDWNNASNTSPTLLTSKQGRQPSPSPSLLNTTGFSRRHKALSLLQ